jgi:2-polyprenyl-3-methyl-5-hydroxy-6-metoxy-1,4-benzoquinol methylase
MDSLKENYETKSVGYYDRVRRDILPLVPKYSNRVLEIGCGRGDTLEYLKSNDYCGWTCGVDLFPEAIESARSKVDEVHQGNIEEMLLPIEPGSIDVILCLDVLEHLLNPEKVVAYLHTLLVPGGAMIASIPNVRHRSVILPLVLQDKWEYQDGGVLDNTHLRFFVRKTAIDLMQSSGLKLDKILFNYGGGKDKFFNAITLGFINSFFKIQYLIKVMNN